MRLLTFIINRRRSIKRTGFTLVELMVVISIIGILAAFLLPSLSGSRSLATRTACVNNLRQIILAAQSYAHDDRQGALTAAFKDDDNDLNNLYPSYMQNLKIFSCPAGRQIIRSNAYLKHPFTDETVLTDLYEISDRRGGFGSGYEPFGFMNFNGTESTEFSVRGFSFTSPGIKKTLNSVSAYVRKSEALGLKGTSVSPSQIWFIVDADSGGRGNGIQNYPDSADNHGSLGGNVSKCDGSVEWIPRNRYIDNYELSQDENRRH